MNLAFSFSTKFNKYSKHNLLKPTISWYKLSMQKAREFGHHIIFYGCDTMLNELDGYYDRGVDVSDKEFGLVDDLKLYVHEKEPIGTITIDGDLVLNKPLQIDESADMVIEMYEEGNSFRYYKPQFDFFKHNPSVENDIEYLDFNNKKACNVGILWFKDEKVRDLLINHYKKFQKYYFDNILPKGGWAKIKHSAVVCQFYFYCLVKSYNIKVSTTKNYGDNDYTHYIGKRKWMYNPIDLQK
tara:strand:+ start:128 stop:850 length:723 start_codon:yes stop_codon:yes gene_type:complete